MAQLCNVAASAQRCSISRSCELKPSGRAGIARSAAGRVAAAVPAIRSRPTRAAQRAAVVASAVATQQQATSVVFHYMEIKLQTQPGIHITDITPQIREELARLGIQEGTVNVLSRHTTTAISINECESRLLDDIRQFLRRLAPPSDPYLHNDLHLREAPPGWPGGWEAWAAQEPENAHSHLLSMVLGNSETIPVTQGKLALGTWQSVMLVELDGPRPRTVGVQIVGHTGSS